MTAATISPWPLVRKGDQQHPVKTLQYLLSLPFNLSGSA